MEGIGSIALIENGSISGHFIHLPHSICYGIHGTGKLLNFSGQVCFLSLFRVVSFFILLEEMVCERECSRGEDYRLLKLTIIDFNVRAINHFCSLN